MARQPHLFLDCDGVLADFDAGAKHLLGMSPKAFEAKHGRGEFWKRLARLRHTLRIRRRKPAEAVDMQPGEAPATKVDEMVS